MLRHSLATKLAAIGPVLWCAAQVCFAHDAVVPPWRGEPFSTFQEWRFGGNANPAAPDSVDNPYGTPSAAMAVGPYGTGWQNRLPGLGTQTGYWDLGSAGTVQLTVPAYPTPPPDSAAWISVQVTYFRDISQPPDVSMPGAARVRSDIWVVENVPTGGQWLVEQSYWRSAASPPLVSALVSASAEWGSVVDQIVVDTSCITSVTSVAAAKKMADGTHFELHGPIVTRSFGTFFYVEDPNRLAGIRVNCAGVQPAPAEGTAPYIVGTMRTINGERVFDQALLYGQDQLPIPGALLMNNPATVIGLSPVGLLIAVTGRASVSGPGATVFTVTDGSGIPTRVQLHGVTAPPDRSYVVVSGALGADMSGPILRVNSSDILTYY